MDEADDESDDEAASSDESYVSEDFDETLEDDNRGVLMITQSLEVLEKSTPMPLLMQHKGHRICGDNLNKNVHRRHYCMWTGELNHYISFTSTRLKIELTSLVDPMRECSISDENKGAPILTFSS